jgi:hypothetical protein
MNATVRAEIERLDDEHLIDQVLFKKNEYTAEAIAIMYAVLRERNITEETINNRARQSLIDDEESGPIINHDQLVALPGSFYQNDILVVHGLMQEKKIPFAVESSGPESDPGEDTVFSIKVPHARLEEAQSILAEHFEKTNNVYTILYQSVKERLKAFHFQEVRIAGIELGAEVSVSLSEKERHAIVQFAGRLMDEADTIEQKQDRVIFYFDNLESLSDRLNQENNASMLGVDLMTIIEIAQIYCEDPEFNDTMETIAAEILALVSK